MTKLFFFLKKKNFLKKTFYLFIRETKLNSDQILEYFTLKNRKEKIESGSNKIKTPKKN